MAISPTDFYTLLKKSNINFFTGIPDSLLKPFSALIRENEHIIAVNEGCAVALASGYYLGTGELTCVYMQNSGLSNAMNPLLSLCDDDVYGIPLLLIIGWRGKPGISDAPQHKKDGRIQTNLLATLEIPYMVIGEKTDGINKKIGIITKLAMQSKRPVAILIEKGAFVC